MLNIMRGDSMSSSISSVSGDMLVVIQGKFSREEL
jgi:hypothetical protein